MVYQTILIVQKITLIDTEYRAVSDFLQWFPLFFWGHVAQALNQSSTRHASLRLNMVHLSFRYWTGDLILEQRARPNMGTDEAALINSGQSEMFAAVHLMFYVPQLQM